MKWKHLPIGQFIEAKGMISRIGDLIGPLYEDTLPEDPQKVVDEAQVQWQAFLAMAVEGDPDPALANVATVSLATLRETSRDFFLHQVGRGQQ